jgi:hypothetical protein
VQVSDIHWDPHYSSLPNANQYCHILGEKQQGLAESSFYGNPGSPCDSPTSLVDMTLGYLGETFGDVEVVFLTGDFARFP